jgi:hypothetical protein
LALRERLGVQLFAIAQHLDEFSDLPGASLCLLDVLNPE